MQSTELSLELAAQERTDPNASVAELIEFDDLDTVLEPLPGANEAASNFPREPQAELELELGPEEIDALLSESGKLKA
jgi:hypothetical protein